MIRMYGQTWLEIRQKIVKWCDEARPSDEMIYKARPHEASDSFRKAIRTIGSRKEKGSLEGDCRRVAPIPLRFAPFIQPFQLH